MTGSNHRNAHGSSPVSRCFQTTALPVWSKNSAQPKNTGISAPDDSFCPSISAAFSHPVPAIQLPGFSSKINSVLGIKVSMNFVLRPWQLFFICLSGWVNRQQQQIIEFQNAQIRTTIPLAPIIRTPPLPKTASPSTQILSPPALSMLISRIKSFVRVF